jgi:biopolymer transport protein ExbD
MKKILIILFCTFLFASGYASGSKKTEKSKGELNLNIQIDKNGELHVNGKVIDDKAIEDWVNQNLKNVSIEINNDTDKKPKKVKLSISIKEK